MKTAKLKTNKQLALFQKTPETWQELEELTELLFQRTGHRTQRKKTAATFRGKMKSTCLQ
jgi:hypothetical protein